MSIIENIIPDKLTDGDTIGIAAPAGLFNREAFFSGINELEKMGFKTLVPERIMSEDRWFAGSDSERADVLHDLFLDQDVKAVVCARGGYGSLRLLNRLDYSLIRDNPKIFVGFSDISALLNTFFKRAGILCYHGPVVTSLGNSDQDTRNYMRRLLRSPSNVELKGDASNCLFQGRAVGWLAGGNLATLNHLSGTPFQPDFTGAILLLEDISEPYYKVDRMLTQMVLAGVFNDIKGVAVGQFTDCGDYDRIIEIFSEKFSDKNIPVVAGFGFGHQKINIPFPVGANAELCSSAATLEYQL